MTTLDEARAALQRHARGPAFVAALEAFEAAVRANERGGTTQAASLREAADTAYRIARRLDDQHHDERAQGAWDVENTLRAELRRLADEAQPQPAHTCNSIMARGEMDEPLGYLICGLCGTSKSPRPDEARPS